MNLRKTAYILPNLFTLGCAVCGFTSMCLSALGRGDTDLYLAALAICFGLLFDTFDGRVARLTKTQTDLGRELDSLADMMTFGAAPALLVYKWALTSFGRLGIFVAAVFVCAGALRLARFNVLSHREERAGQEKPGKYTVGLTIPMAASVLVLMVIVSHNAGEYRIISEGGTAAIVLVLSVLMVSKVRFRSFKEVRLNKRTIGVLLIIVGGSVAVVGAGLEKAFIFLFLVLAYIALGLGEELLWLRRRRLRAHAEHKPDSDEELLREIRAMEEEGETPTPHMPHRPEEPI